MIKAEIKRPPIETRIALGNIVKVGTIDGAMAYLDAPLANWEYASVGLFGKMVANLTNDEKLKLDTYSDNDITEFAKKVKDQLGNPSTG